MSEYEEFEEQLKKAREFYYSSIDWSIEYDCKFIIENPKIEKLRFSIERISKSL